MLNIKILCVGKLKEPFYIDAAAEYAKRLGAYCRLEVEALPEARRSANPSPAETAAALEKEAEALLRHIPRGAAVIALCVEGRELDSEGFSALLTRYAAGGVSRLCFVIGGSDGLAPAVKQSADLQLSMSKMTFPHHLARILLLEQLYRGFQIAEGGKYHK